MIQQSPTLTRENYDEDTHYLRHSAVEDFIKSPSLYRHRWIHGAERSESASLMLGRVSHTLVLEGYDPFQDWFAVAPKLDKRTKIGKEELEKFCFANVGKTIIDAPIYSQACNINEAVRSHSAASQLLDALDHVEQPLTFDFAGMPCKARLDGVCLKGSGFILDLKTSRDPYPDAFARACYSYGYHRQAHWYLEAAQQHYQREFRFIFVAVDVEQPHDVFVYELDDDAIRLAEEENHAAVSRLSAIIAEEENTIGDTSHLWVHPESLGIRSLSLPRWATGKVVSCE